MRYRIPNNADVDRAFQELRRRGMRKGIEFSGGPSRGTIRTNDKVIEYTVVGNTINILFPSISHEMCYFKKVSALLDDVFY